MNNRKYPKEIYLQDIGDEITWCEDEVSEDTIHNVKYYHYKTVDKLRAEIDRLKKEYYQMDTNQSDNLRPCPFCGNKNPRVVHHFVNGIANLSHCFVRCNCGRGKTTASRKEEHGAVDEWNTRPVEDALRAEIAHLSELLHDEMSQLEIATDLGNKRWIALNEIYENAEKHNANWCKRKAQEGLGIK